MFTNFNLIILVLENTCRLSLWISRYKCLWDHIISCHRILFKWNLFIN